MGRFDRIRRLARAINPIRVVASRLPTVIRQSFLAKLLVTVAVILVAGAGIGTFFFFGISDTLDSQVDRNVRATTELQTTVYDNWFRNRRDELSATARQGYITDTDSESISAELSTAQARSDVISEYHLVDGPTGRVVGSSEDAAIGQNIYTASAVEPSLIRNASGIVVPGRFRTFDEESVLLLRTGASYTDRVLVGEVEPERLPRLPQSFEGSTTYVVSQSGAVVAGSTPAPFAPKTAPRTPTVNRTAGSLYTYNQIPGTSLVLVMETPVDTAFAVKQEVLLSFGLTLVLIFGVITTVALSSGETAIRDLMQLADRSRAMAAGKLDVELSTDREDEIGVLYASFAEMRDSLRNRIREAESAQETAQAAREQLAARNEDIEEQRAIISVLNRVLRHNLRNDLTVVWSHLDFVRDHADEAVEEEHLAAIERKLRELVERADKAREIEQLTRGTDRPLVPVDITAVVDTEVERFRELYPDATIEIETDGQAIICAHEAVGFVVANLVENALEHNESDDPFVAITVSTDDDLVTVEIADDGPGIPETELDSLELGYETAIEHGSGLGLWLVNWLVDEMDGDIEFDDREPTGTVVTLRFEQTDAEATTPTVRLDHD
jgi:methyl-accepting chemotaxis protein